MSFNLFDAEDRLLDEAQALRLKMADAPGDLRAGVDALVEAYGRGVREQRRLVKVSDRLQAQLAALNHELARRKAEAEDALARLKETQESLVQSEKLASLGALVAGVAHEINTPIGVALSCATHLTDATLALKKLFEADDIGVDDFERYMATATDTSRLVQSNCERAAALIRGFKQVAVDRASAERRTFNLRTSIEETLVSLGPRLRQAGIAVDLDCPADIEATSYPGALSQVLANLAMNSLAHAYAPGQAGRIAISVSLPDPGRIRLVFADDGKGIAPEHHARVFDPFFTTRRGSGGSGLGLHIVYNLATGPLEGSVTLDDTADKGSRFVLNFARTTKAAV